MLVSVIIPYFSDKKNIKNAVKSASQQTYKQLEIIIIDDENSKESQKILINLKKEFKKIKIISNLRQMGVSHARNKGIKLAKGDFIAFLDSDDLWKKNKIMEQLSFIKKYGSDICYTNYVAIDDNHKILYKVRTPKILFYDNLLRECPISCSSVLMKKKVLKKFKFKNLKTKEDYLLWLKLSKRNVKMLAINKNLTFWRKTSNSLSSSVVQKFKDAFLVYNKHLKFNFIVSIILILLLSINSLIKRYL